MSSSLLAFAAGLAALQLAAGNAGACSGNATAERQSRPSVMLLQTASRFHAQDKGNVLYMVKSYKGFYETKLRALLKTWGSMLSKSSLLVLGDEDWPEYPISKASMCESDATEGLSCRVAYGVTLAAKHPGNWSWLFVVDDDHYVWPVNVEKQLSKMDATKPVGAGCYGCGAPQYCDGHGGFCGGCGYALSRAAVMAVVGSNATEFQAYHDKISRSKKSEGREDMALSCALRERVPDLRVQQMLTMHGEEPNLQTLRPDQDDTMTWHHITPEMMENIHHLIVKGSTRADA